MMPESLYCEDCIEGLNRLLEEIEKEYNTYKISYYEGRVSTFEWQVVSRVLGKFIGK